MLAEPMEVSSPEPEINHRHIFRFYLPLALSWIFMAIESPIALSVISRMANAEINQAAFQPLMALALLIESPVIDLLTTATTLGKDRQHFEQLSRFAWRIMIFVTVVHTIVAVTPLYWTITLDLINLKREVAEAARPGLILMIPWSAFIGWRRYLQGLMIRHGQTRLIGYGTAIRMGTMSLVALALFLYSSLPSISIVSISLISSVGAEAIFAHFASRAVIQSHLASDNPELNPLTLRFLARFHLPLTATTIVTILSQPLISTALARSPEPILALGSFQVASSLIWLHRTIVFALPEVVITLYRHGNADAQLRKFCLMIGLITTGTLGLTAATNLDSWIFRVILGVTSEETIQMAHLCLAMSFLLPLFGALQSYLRGVLAAHHLTVSRLAAIFVSLACMLGTLVVGVVLRWPGVATACLALTLSQIAEFLVLARAWRTGQAKLATV
jgi:progressive ankylosis protein